MISVETELWKTVSRNYRYEVSNLGTVRRLTPGRHTFPGRMLKPIQWAEYLAVRLSEGIKDKSSVFSIHRLVAEAFIGPYPKGKEVNHKNGNKHDNHVDNLEYLTRAENLKHAYRTGLRVRPLGEKNGRAVLTEENVKEIRNLYATGNFSQEKIGQMFGVEQTRISAIVTRKQWKHI